MELEVCWRLGDDALKRADLLDDISNALELTRGFWILITVFCRIDRDRWSLKNVPRRAAVVYVDFLEKINKNDPVSLKSIRGHDSKD